MKGFLTPLAILAALLAGLVLELLNEFPQPHQKTAYRNLQFEVLRVNERRITRIKVTRTTPPAPSEKKK